MNYSDVRDYIDRALKLTSPIDREQLRVALTLALQDIGAQANWEFKQGTTPITTSSGTESYSITNVETIRNITAVYNSNGVLSYLPIEEFRRRFAGDTTVGIPTHYSFWENEILFRPIPSGTITYTCDLIRRMGDNFKTLLDEDGAPLLIAATLHYMNPDDNLRLLRYERLLKATLKNIPKVKDSAEYIQQDELREAHNKYIEGLY